VANCSITAQPSLIIHATQINFNCALGRRVADWLSPQLNISSARTQAVIAIQAVKGEGASLSAADTNQS
jgi:hypothetical protein